MHSRTHALTQVVGQQHYGATKSGHPWGYYTDEEFASGPCKDADFWFYPGTNFREPDAAYGHPEASP